MIWTLIKPASPTSLTLVNFITNITVLVAVPCTFLSQRLCSCYFLWQITLQVSAWLSPLTLLISIQMSPNEWCFATTYAKTSPPSWPFLSCAFPHFSLFHSLTLHILYIYLFYSAYQLECKLHKGKLLYWLFNTIIWTFFNQAFFFYYLFF